MMTNINGYRIAILVGISSLLVITANGDRSISNDHLTNDWEAWKVKYGKSYASRDDELHRRRLWVKKVEAVARHNQAYKEGRESYSQAVYAWADKDESEIYDFNSNQQLTSFDWTVDDDQDGSCQFVASTEVPDELDYRDWRYVTSVDDQGECSSCWTYAVTGAIEALMARTTGELEKLSNQQLLDCTIRGNNGCVGGNTGYAMQYALKSGMQTDCTYPYVGEKEECHYNADMVAFKFRKFRFQKYTSEEMLKELVATTGPVITHIFATPSFYDYKNNIYSTRECYLKPSVNHAVLIVGYGTEGGKDYWLLKNSYGTSWGEKGYMRFQRNIGLCNIGTGNIRPVA